MNQPLLLPDGVTTTSEDDLQSCNTERHFPATAHFLGEADYAARTEQNEDPDPENLRWQLSLWMLSLDDKAIKCIELIGPFEKLQQFLREQIIPLSERAIEQMTSVAKQAHSKKKVSPKYNLDIERETLPVIEAIEVLDAKNRVRVRITMVNMEEIGVARISEDPITLVLHHNQLLAFLEKNILPYYEDAIDELRVMSEASLEEVDRGHKDMMWIASS